MKGAEKPNLSGSRVGKEVTKRPTKACKNSAELASFERREDV